MDRQAWRTAAAAGALLVLAAAPAAVAGPTPEPPGLVDLGGTPVVVSTDAGRPAPLTAGLWSDTLSGPGTADGNAHRFRYARTMEGSTVFVGVVATSPETETTDQLSVVVETPDGDPCDEATASSDYSTPGATFGVQLVAPEDEYADRADACLIAPALDITVSRGTADLDSDLPLAIRVVEEGPLSYTEEPAAPVTEAPPTPSPAEPAEVTGASSFADAPELTTGTYGDVVPEGSERLYRVRLGWGQSLAVRVDVPRAEGADAARLDADSASLRLSLLSPLLGPLAGADEAVLAGTYGAERSTLYDATGSVDYLQRFDGASTTVPGEYVVSLAAGRPGDRPPVDVPVELTVDVVGAPASGPRFAETVRAPDSGSGPAGYAASAPYLLGDGEFGAEVSGTPRAPAGASGGTDRATGAREVAGGVVGALSLVCLAVGVVLLRRRRVSPPAAR